MKIKQIPLHIKILLALVLGAAFGAIFNIDQNKLDIGHISNKSLSTHIAEDWQTLTFYSETENGLEELKSFGPDDQIQIIKFHEANRKKGNIHIAYTVDNNGKPIKISSINSVTRVHTVATYIKPIGVLFIRLLSFLAIPLVIATLIIGAASLGDIKKLGRMGGRTFLIYICTTAVAITIGLAAANIIGPGYKVDSGSKNRLLGEYQEESSEKLLNDIDVDIPEFIVNIVPKNPVNAMANGNMLQIVFFAVLFGVTLTFIEKKKSAAVLDFFSGVSETMIKMVDFIMKIAPYGVFALMAATIADFGFGILSTLVWYILAVISGLLLHTLVVYPLMAKYLGNMSPVKFMKGMRNAQIIGFSTSSSAATLPVTIDCVENKLGVSKQVSGFVLPLGATINMDGTALYQGVAAVFIAQVYGFDLSIVQQLTIVFTAVMASIGTAPAPGLGLIMLVMILQAVNIPPEGIALILGVDRILDMCRTVTNVTGDSSVAVAIAGLENRRLKNAGA